MNKLQRLVAIHGLGGTFTLLWTKFVGLVLYFTPARRRARAALREKDLSFDRRWGVDTAGKEIPSETDVIGASWAYGSRYQGIDAESFEQSLNELHLDFPQFTFIDIGSGKGRAVLIASQHPFARVIGVEYAAQFHAVAQQNVSRFPVEEVRCGAIDLVCDDATKFELPAGPLVLFLYNPFGEVIMNEVMANVRRSYQQVPRRIIVLYFYPVAADVWKNCGFATEIKATEWLSIFDTHPKSAQSAAAA